jgi:hypothetical protein
MSRFLLALALGAIPALAGCSSSLGGEKNCFIEGNATRFVDRQLGTDDALHGGNAGDCAFRTLAYALAHATSAISLDGTDVYQGGVDGVELPIRLTGMQQLFCNGGILENAADQGTYEGIVQLAGIQNGVTSCVFEGLGWGGYLLSVNSVADGMHFAVNTSFDHGGNVAVWVGPGGDNLALQANTFFLNNVSIQASGSHANVRIDENTFTSDGLGNYDVVCDDVEPGITGASNTATSNTGYDVPITCGVCGGCPFGP